MPFVNELGGGIRRTIDYDRNVSLRQLGGRGRDHKEYEIDWDGQKFSFMTKKYCVWRR